MEVKGTKELLRKLNSISSKAVGVKIIKNAVAKGCHTVQGAAKLLCPVDTGELRNSIVTKVEEKSDRVIGKVYTNKEYAPYVELGTTSQSAQPYMYPALKDNEEEVKNQIAEEIAKEIRKMVE